MFLPIGVDMSAPHLNLSLDAREQWIFNHLRERIQKDCPLREGPYALSLRPLSASERADWYGQEGPVLYDSMYVYARVYFEGLTHGGEPWEIDGIVRLYALKELEARADAMVRAFLAFCRRIMRDVQDMRLGPPGWLGLVHLQGAMMDLLKAPPKKTQSFEQCMAVLLASKQVRGLVMPDEVALVEAMNALDAWCASRQVVLKSEREELCIVEQPSWNGPGEISKISAHGVEVNRRGIFLTLRLAIFDEKGEVMDLKEQQLFLLALGELSEAPRMCACLEGWARVLPKAFAKWERDQLAAAVPSDFFDAGAIRLKKPVAVEDFVKVFERRLKV